MLIKNSSETAISTQLLDSKRKKNSKRMKMRVYLSMKKLIRKRMTFLVVLCLVIFTTYSLVNTDFYYNYVASYGSRSHTKADRLEEINKKVSWEDNDLINYEATRVGFGEQGVPVIVTDPIELEENQRWMKQEGFFAAVSDKMSFSRALPDYRLPVCKTIKYFEKLPSVSVIVVFHNEIRSMLLRCLHSIYNRTPKSLLHEIVMVNDKSTFPELYEPLQTYLKKEFGDKIKMIENEEREGVIRARMIGAKAASAEVIIFLDSHMEVCNSWLPPLLDPLVENPTFLTVPVIDGMDPMTFQPTFTGHGFRGSFDWNFRFQWLPLRKKDVTIKGAPYELACMTGGVYAIKRDHFFHLGGYDEGMQIWNGENYEMSIKQWLCSGKILEVPCSRVVHLSKVHSRYRESKRVADFMGYNLKRIAEVWLDEYKEYFYRGEQSRYDNLDVGDLTNLFEKKKSLNCKPFKYYLEVVAPEILKYYPITPQYFAAGKIESMATGKCIGMASTSYGDPLELVDCNKPYGLNFIFTFEESIKFNNTDDQCLNYSKMNLYNCFHHVKSSQFFKFNIHTRQIIHPLKDMCLETRYNDTLLSLSKCDENLTNQKWRWTYENTTALMNWDENVIKFE